MSLVGVVQLVSSVGLFEHCAGRCVLIVGAAAPDQRPSGELTFVGLGCSSENGSFLICDRESGEGFVGAKCERRARPVGVRPVAASEPSSTAALTVGDRDMLSLCVL